MKKIIYFGPLVAFCSISLGGEDAFKATLSAPTDIGRVRVEMRSWGSDQKRADMLAAMHKQAADSGLVFRPLETEAGKVMEFYDLSQKKDCYVLRFLDGRGQLKWARGVSPGQI